MATGTNANAIDFAVGSAGDDASHWQLWDSSSGGNRLWRAALSNSPADLMANQFYQVAAGDIEIEVPVGSEGAEDEAAIRAVNGILDGSTYLQLFDNTTAVTGRVEMDLADNDWMVAA